MKHKHVQQWRSEAHEYFDIIWRDGHEKRQSLYQHLADHLKLPIEQTHIRLFNIETCKEVIDWSKMILNDLRRLDMDFGLNVKREHYERV